jgi:exopolyphosphatase/guanosine-5'-triphosphate,3'-diphosphate pyrophosphatase
MPLLQNPMRLAAIDLGTNSFHMIIVELLPDMSFLTIDRAKEMIRIGDGSLTTKMLSEEAMSQGLQTLTRFRKLAEQRGVETHHIIAFATSAIREAKNGGVFMETVSQQLGIRTCIISGDEEARLIYLAIRQAISIGKRKALMIDVGGGSVELMIGDSEKLYLEESRKLGVARMYERFIKHDPPTEKERAELEQFFIEQITPFATRAKSLGYDMAIASSGTAENIASMIFIQENGQAFESLNGNAFSRKSFQKLYERLLPMKSSERKSLEGLDPKRADLIIPGLILFDVVFRLFNLKEITISGYALREGMIIDYLSKHVEEFRLIYAIPDVRRRSVVELARRCHWDEARSIHIANLALQIFDELQPLHGLSSHERELLDYASLLHNIGYFISPSGHHKHSQYIILNGDLRGFSNEEIQVMAHIARYHRKSPPKPEHETFQMLSSKHKQFVKYGAAILRIANALDRTHRQNVRGVKAKISAKKIELRLTIMSDAEIEMWAVSRAKDMFESVFNCELSVSVEAVAD